MAFTQFEDVRTSGSSVAKLYLSSLKCGSIFWSFLISEVLISFFNKVAEIYAGIPLSNSNILSRWTTSDISSREFLYETEVLCGLTKVVAPWWHDIAPFLSALACAVALFRLVETMALAAVGVMLSNIVNTEAMRLEGFLKAVHHFLSTPYHMTSFFKDIWFVVVTKRAAKLIAMYCDKNLLPSWFCPVYSWKSRLY